MAMCIRAQNVDWPALGSVGPLGFFETRRSPRFHRRFRRAPPMSTLDPLLPIASGS